MLSKSTHLILFILTLTAQNVKSQGIAQERMSETDTIFSNKVLEEVVVTGNYKATGIDKSVVPTRIISLQKLAPLAVQNVGEVLKYQANLRIQQDNILGAGMSMQGISGENVKILLNGVPLNGRQNGNIDLGQLNVNNVERIEIVEGPLSVQYGTNALAGTINIITKKNPSKSLDLQASLYHESVGHYNAQANLGIQKGQHSLMASGGRNFFAGWSDADYGRFQTWKPKIQYFGDVNYTLTAGKMQIGYMGNYLNEFILNRGRPLVPYFKRAFDDHYMTTRLTNSLTFSSPLGNRLKTNILLSYNDYSRTKNTYYRDLVTLSEVKTTNEGDQDTTQFNLLSSRGTITNINSGKFNFEAGYDINVETGSGLRLKNKQQQIGDYAAFMSAEWQLNNRLTLRPGLRVAYNTSYASPIIPSLNMLWKVSNELNVRMSYGRGFRAPSLKELYFYFVDINHNIRGNENLEAEKSHNVNAFLTYKKVVDKNIYKIESNLFVNNINNLITLALLRGEQNEYGYVNIGQFRTIGGQCYGEVVLNNLTVGSGASLMRSVNVFNDNDYTAETWETRSNVTYNFVKAKINVNFWFKHTGKQPGYILNEDGKVQPTFLDSFNMADVGAGKTLLKDKTVVSFGIKNIFDVKNINSQLAGGAHSSTSGSSSLATGRNFYVKCEIRL